MSDEKYISSITTRYGDVEQVKADVKTLNEILDRQGDKLFFDVIAEHSGNTVIKFKIDEKGRCNLLNALLAEFQSALAERI